jgi:hypothetical protein
MVELNKDAEWEEQSVESETWAVFPPSSVNLSSVSLYLPECVTNEKLRLKEMR